MQNTSTSTLIIPNNYPTNNGTAYFPISQNAIPKKEPFITTLIELLDPKKECTFQEELFESIYNIIFIKKCREYTPQEVTILKNLLFSTKKETQNIATTILDTICSSFPATKTYIQKLRTVQQKNLTLNNNQTLQVLLQTLSQTQATNNQGQPQGEKKTAEHIIYREKMLTILQQTDQQIYDHCKAVFDFITYDPQNTILTLTRKKGHEGGAKFFMGLYQNNTRDVIGDACREACIPLTTIRFISPEMPPITRDSLPSSSPIEQKNISSPFHSLYEYNTPPHIQEYIQDRKTAFPYLELPYQNIEEYVKKKSDIYIKGDLGMAKDILLSAFFTTFKEQHPEKNIASIGGEKFCEEYLKATAKDRERNKKTGTFQSEHIKKFLEQFSGMHILLLENLEKVKGPRTQACLINILKRNDALLIATSRANIKDMQVTYEYDKPPTNILNICNHLQLIEIPQISLSLSNKITLFTTIRKQKIKELPPKNTIPSLYFPNELINGIKIFITESEIPTDQYEILINGIIAKSKLYLYNPTMNMGKEVFNLIEEISGKMLIPKEEWILDTIFSIFNEPKLREKYIHSKHMGNIHRPLFETKADIIKEKFSKHSAKHIVFCICIYFFTHYFFPHQRTQNMIATYFGKSNITSYYKEAKEWLEGDGRPLATDIKQCIEQQMKQHYGISAKE